MQVLIAEVSNAETFLKLAKERDHLESSVDDLSNVPTEKVNFFINNWNSIVPLLKAA